jgi:hypothetical protein
MRGGARTVVEPHDRFKGVYILRGKDDALVTKNLTVGESVYNEKRVYVDVSGPTFYFGRESIRSSLESPNSQYEPLLSRSLLTHLKSHLISVLT